jgi:hypothetical protein
VFFDGGQGFHCQCLQVFKVQAIDLPGCFVYREAGSLKGAASDKLLDVKVAPASGRSLSVRLGEYPGESQKSNISLVELPGNAGVLDLIQAQFYKPLVGSADQFVKLHDSYNDTNQDCVKIKNRNFSPPDSYEQHARSGRLGAHLVELARFAGRQLSRPVLPRKSQT